MGCIRSCLHQFLSSVQSDFIMKMQIIFALYAVILAVASAKPVEDPAETHVVRLESETNVDSYRFALETSDGKTHEEEGQLKQVGEEGEAIVVRGSFSYVGDDGQTYTVHYIADENGFQPEGAHLPSAASVANATKAER